MLGSGRVSSLPEEKLPKDFGKYRLIRRIATGGMAEIFLANERRTPDAPVVIKRILPHLVESAEFVSMFLDEARIAAQLHHENIVEIYDVGRVDGAYFIAMEFVHGEDIRRIYNRAYKLQRSLPLSHSIRVIAESSLGLGFAHKLPDLTGKPMGVVHRDVSPQNILVTYGGGVKIVDFGIAKAASKVNETRAGVLKGKYSYMSPEQATGDPIDHRTDIFALGIILYETTTGTRLFKRHNELATLQAIMKCDVTPPSEALNGYPIELESIVMKALAKDPKTRYQRGEDLSRDLFAFLKSSGLYVEPEVVAGFMLDLFGEEAEESRFVPSTPEPPSDPSKSVSVSDSQVVESTHSLHNEDVANPATAPADAVMPNGVEPPGFLDDDDMSAADGTIAEDREDIRPNTTIERPPAQLDDATAPPDAVAAVDDEQPTIAAAPVYRASTPSVRSAPTPDGIEHTDRVRAHRATTKPPTKPRRSKRPQPARAKASPSTLPAKPALIVGAAALILGMLVLAAVLVDRIFRGEPEPPTPPPPIVRVAPLKPVPTLAPTGPSGDVTIMTEPNAAVSANDVALGRADARGVAGPFRLAPGRQLVRVSLAATGFERVRALSVRANQVYEIEIPARQGRLRLAVAPWARVKIDGHDVGITPLQDLLLVEGTHHVVLENPDIQRRHDTLIRVEPGKIAELKVDLNELGERM